MVRFKNRYFLCRIDSQPEDAKKLQNLSAREINTIVRASVADNFGDATYGQTIASLAVKSWSPALSLCLVRSPRDHYRTTWAAISLITSAHPAASCGTLRFTVLHTGGTIRSCLESAVRHARQLMLDASSEGADTAKLQRAATSFEQELQDERM